MPTTKDLIEIAALEDEFDLFDGELIKAGEAKKKKRSQSSASSTYSFYPIEAQQSNEKIYKVSSSITNPPHHHTVPHNQTILLEGFKWNDDGKQTGGDIVDQTHHTAANGCTATLTSSSTTPPTTPSSSSDTFDKEVWDIVLEAKKAYHEQVSSEPFNPQDHELLPSNLSQSSDDKPQLSSPSEPSLPENGGHLVATFKDGRPSVSVSISFSGGSLMTTFHNSRLSIKLSTNNQRKSVKSSKAKLVKVATIEELKMESPRLCSDESCSLVACCQWELDGELSHECLDHQEK